MKAPGDDIVGALVVCAAFIAMLAVILMTAMCALADSDPRLAIADRNPSGGDVKQAPSRSDESGGAQSAIAQSPNPHPPSHRQPNP